MPKESVIRTYMPSDKALKILEDVYECEEKGMTNRGVAGISQRTGLGKEDVSAEAWELEQEGYLKAYENKRNKGLKTYFVTEKGKSCLPTEWQELQAVQNDGPLGRIETAVLEAAVKSSYNGSVTARYIATVLRESEGYANSVLKELAKNGYMQRQPQRIGSAEFDTYVINENGRQMLKAKPDAPAKQAPEIAEHPPNERVTLSVTPGELPRMPPATEAAPKPVPAETAEQPKTPPKSVPVPDYLDRAVSVLQSSDRGSPIRESARDDLLIAMAQKLQELENKINERMPIGAMTPAATKTGPPREKFGEHERAVLRSVLTAAEDSKYVTDAKLFEAYTDVCKTMSVQPQSPVELKNSMKALRDRKLVRTERVGCRALGIKEQGRKAVYYLTEEGKKAADL